MNKNLIFGAHPDDEVLGPGGTAASLVMKGEVVKSVVFSQGNKWPPWRSDEDVGAARREESIRAGRVLGIEKAEFLGLGDMGLPKAMDDEGLIEKVRRIIERVNPHRVFYHSKNDTHPDHVAVNTIVSKALERVSCEPKCYTFEISNLVSFFERKDPKIFFDITQTLSRKIKAMRAFKSQKLIMLPLIPIILWRAYNYGRKAGFKYAERFSVAKF